MLDKNGKDIDMAVDHTFAIKKFRSLKEMYVLYSAATQMPFVTCDAETYNDQIWVFTEESKMQEFAKPYLENKMLLRGMIIKQEVFNEFYGNLHAMGVNEIVFQDGTITHKLDVNSVVKFPDFSKLPEAKRPVLNPELTLSSIYFLQAVRRPGAQLDKNAIKELEEEMCANLARAKYLMPVMMTKDENGKDRVNAMYMQNKEGEKFQPVFSDSMEFAKFCKDKKGAVRLLKLTISDLNKTLAKEIKGYALNPNSFNLILGKEQLEMITKNYL